MIMQYYFAINNELELLDSDKHHIINVMRMNKGDHIIIIYDGFYNECIIESINSKEVIYKVINSYSKKSNDINIVMAIPLIKEQRFDYMIQKITEIGVSKIIPYKTERSIIKINDKDWEKKKERYCRIVKEASEQCHRANIPIIDNLRDIDYLINNKCNLNILFTVNEVSRNIKEVFKNNNKYDTLLLVIGPEGGFSKFEEDKFVTSGFISTSLNENVLRSETAAVYVMSVVDYNNLR